MIYKYASQLLKNMKIVSLLQNKIYYFIKTLTKSVL